ncbi:MAG: tRNA (guanosine(37)-N1)-methyltransferase TrmD [Anaerolineales bacterium]|jgi:tRNA (guanine37-N1)-methyltransferase
MKINVFTLFPEVFRPYLDTSILRRAIQNQLVKVYLNNIRDWTADRHHITDDTPYGGGGGMIMKPEPIFTAVERVLGEDFKFPIILLTPQGRLFDQSVALELSRHRELALICGRYEGIDERVREHLVTDEISIGDYVLSGGELPAMVMIDSIVRLLPGALGDPTGAQDDSHSFGLLEYPHYTRPNDFRGWEVPDVLSSGDHARINQWRREQALLRTHKRRPDLLQKAELSEEDRKFLDSLDTPD